MKKLSIIIISLLVVLSLTGCGKSADGGAKATTDVNSNTQKPVTLSISMHVANVKDQEPYMYGIVQKFQEKYPNIKVDLQGDDTDTHVKKMKMAAQANELPDIFWMLPAPAKEMNKAGMLLDLTDFIKNNNEIASSMDPKLLQGYQDGGQTVRSALSGIGNRFMV